MYPKDQEDFLKKTIKSGKYTRKETCKLFDEKFKKKRKMSLDAIKNFTRTRGLKFPDRIHDAWTEQEESIFKGLWLVGASYRRKLIELSTRGKKAMERKNTRMNEDGSFNMWYNHSEHQPRGLHFCSAIYKQDLMSTMWGGFDERFAMGYCYDDDEFAFRAKKNLNFSIVDEPYVEHQWHPKYNNDWDLTVKNEKIFKKLTK